MTSVTILLLFALQSPDGAPVRADVREIEVTGSTVFGRDTVLAMMRLKPGEPLRREPAAIARSLQNRYHVAGYPAARVRATVADQRLLLEVDEGRLRELVIDGVSGAAARRAREAAGLETGTLLSEMDVWAALTRVEAASGGAVQTRPGQPYTVEPVEDGARLILHFHAPRVRASIGPWEPPPGLHNHVDGFALGLAAGVQLVNASTYNHLRLTGRATYGFTSQTVRYTLGAERAFGRDGRITLGYRFHDLTDSEDFFRRYGLEAQTGGSFNTSRHSDLYRRLGHQAHAFAGIGHRAQVGIAFRSDGYTSLVPAAAGAVNPPVDEGRSRSFIGVVRLVSRGELHAGPQESRESFLVPSLFQGLGPKPVSWRLDATYEVSRPGLGSDFDFDRLIGRVRLRQRPGRRHVVDAVALLGRGSGTLPVQKRFALGGPGTLRGSGFKDRSGDHMVFASVEWSWLPPPRHLPAVIPFYDGGVVWGRPQPAESEGWRHGVGLALRWPRSGPVFARVDAAVPVDPGPGRGRQVRWNLRLHYPF